jgi:hypothetical protein
MAKHDVYFIVINNVLDQKIADLVHIAVEACDRPVCWII